MSWIATISYKDATDKLRSIYERIKGPDDRIDNILMLHSLRPHTLEGHMVLYKNVLHHARNQLPKWVLECIGIYVSILNGCQYCIDHHYEGLKKLISDDQRAINIKTALENNNLDSVFESREHVILQYARKLTVAPKDLTSVDIDSLRAQGLTDGEILEINQVAAYFAYANRTVLGLGCTTEGEVVGLSPNDSDDPNNWHHK